MRSYPYPTHPTLHTSYRTVYRDALHETFSRLPARSMEDARASAKAWLRGPHYTTGETVVIEARREDGYLYTETWGLYGDVLLHTARSYDLAGGDHYAA